MEIGDRVKLKSGGPEMTIDGFEHSATGDVSARCSWFTEAGQLKRNGFAPGSLESVPTGILVSDARGVGSIGIRKGLEKGNSALVVELTEGIKKLREAEVKPQ